MSLVDRTTVDRFHHFKTLFLCSIYRNVFGLNGILRVDGVVKNPPNVRFDISSAKSEGDSVYGGETASNERRTLFDFVVGNAETICQQEALTY
jgi:hypothetical protein